MPPRKIRVSLTVIEGEDEGKVFTLKKKKVSIGRAGDIVLRDPKASRKHAIIEVKKGSVFVKDAGSTNGIFVNDVKVEGTELKNLDQIAIGFSKLSIAIVEDLQSFKDKNIRKKKSAKDSKKKADINIGKLIEEELSQFSRWDVSGESSDEPTVEKRSIGFEAYIEVIEGPDKGKRSKLKRGHTTLGRGKVDISFRDTDISRSHAEIEIFGPAQMFVRDLASTNGTYLNSRKVSYSRLKNNDLIQIGGTIIKFTVPD